MRPIHLSVIGVPEPMGSKRIGRRGSNGQPVIIDAKDVPLRNWQRSIAQAATDWFIEHRQLGFDEPVMVRAVFYLQRPKSKPSWYHWPESRPDADKLVRATLDPLTGVLFRDDAQVVRLKVTKRYADNRPPGVDITITPLGRQVSPRARARLLSEEG